MKFLTPCLALVAAFGGLALFAPATECGQEAEAARPAAAAADFQPVAPVGSLMTGLGTAFGQLNEVVKNPRERNRMDRIGAWAEVVAELSNVNTLHHGELEGYQQMAADTRDLALGLSKAARGGNLGELDLMSQVSAIDASCSACHDTEY